MTNDMLQALKQKQITFDDIQEMITRTPRRMKLSEEWPEPLHEPDEPGRDWSLVLPFCETFGNAFETMCPVRHIGLRQGKGGRGYTFFPTAEEDPSVLDAVRGWIDVAGAYVAIRDCLALSFALDYEREKGNPQKPQTMVARLRARAKTYGGAATRDTYVAADGLIRECLEFLEKMTCYRHATCVVAMPSSRPDKPFDLTRYLAAGIADGLRKPDKSDAVITTCERPPVRTVPIEEKLAAIEGTITVDPTAVRGESVLLIEDVYQSGVSMNYVGMLLLQAGARHIFGLACEKTCTNDDNVRRGHLRE